MYDSYATQSQQETTFRLLTTLMNEGLVNVTFFTSDTRQGLQILLKPCAITEEWTQISTSVSIDEEDDCHRISGGSLLPMSPNDLQHPVVLETRDPDPHNRWINPDAVTLFEVLFSSFGYDSRSKAQICEELKTSARFQAQWLRQASLRVPPSLEAPSIDWEMAIIRGHPTHPMHRTLLAQDPLATISPKELPKVQEPIIIFFAAPRHYFITTGKFEEALAPLLEENGIDVSAVPRNCIVVPCLERQLPSIARQIGPVDSLVAYKPLIAKAQSSLRTVSLPNSSAFSHDLKLAFACNITSALRTITPWTALIGPEISDILAKTLPREMWVCNEVAAITGSNPDFDKAKHLSVLIRENLEQKARARDERLIVTAALAERGADDIACHAEIIFELYTEELKYSWFRNYTSKFLACTLPPIYESGVSLEGHAQNILARFHIDSKILTGFAYRDFGGLKLHTPTLAQKGLEVKSSPPGSLILTENMRELYENCHHTIFQSHLNQILQALGLRKSRAWAIVREELAEVLEPDRNGQARGLYDFLMQDTVPLKCFLRMKMEGLYRDYIHHDVPNVILR